MFVFSFGMRHELQISELSAYSNLITSPDRAKYASFKAAQIAILSQDAAAFNDLASAPKTAVGTLSFRYSLVTPS